MNEAYFIVVLSGLMVALSQIHFYYRSLQRIKITSHNYSIDFTKVVNRTRTLTIIYILLFFPLLKSLGGAHYLFRNGVQSLLDSGNSLSTRGITETLFLVIPVVCLLTQIILKFKYKIRTNRFWVIINLIWVVILANPLAHSRQSVLFSTLPFAFLLAKKYRRIGLLLIYAIPIILLYLADLINRYTGAISFNFRTPITSRLGDLDAFPQLANGIDKVTLGFFPLLHQILGSLFFFVPRSIWIGKPLDTGIALGQLSGLHFVNLSAPWTLEAFVNARIVGVVLIAILVGFILAQIETRGFELVGILYGAIVAGSMFIVLRGSLLQATGRITFSVILILLLTSRSRIPQECKE